MHGRPHWETGDDTHTLTTRILAALGYSAAVTINKHANDSATPRTELGRFDCIDPEIHQP